MVDFCELTFSVGTEVDRKGEFWGRLFFDDRAVSRQQRIHYAGGHVTGGSPYMFTRVRHVTLPSDATSAERAHAFAYDLSCVTRLGGCRDVSEILAPMPIRQDYDARHPD